MMKDVLTLFELYTVEQIIVFIVVIALALKGVVDFVDWVKCRITQKITKINEKSNQETTMKENIDKLYEMQIKQNEEINKLAKSVNVLIESDKDDIKAWITKQHHHFCYEVGYIDAFSLDCIERRFAHYKDEGGNSFIEDLMKDLRTLRKISSTLIVQEEETVRRKNENK